VGGWFVGRRAAPNQADTSLLELGADELDFVELVMELEERFDISISNEAADGLVGTDDWKRGLKNVTIAKLL